MLAVMSLVVSAAEDAASADPTAATAESAAEDTPVCRQEPLLSSLFSCLFDCRLQTFASVVVDFEMYFWDNWTWITGSLVLLNVVVLKFVSDYFTKEEARMKSE